MGLLNKEEEKNTYNNEKYLLKMLLVEGVLEKN